MCGVAGAADGVATGCAKGDWAGGAVDTPCGVFCGIGGVAAGCAKGDWPKDDNVPAAGDGASTGPACCP